MMKKISHECCILLIILFSSFRGTHAIDNKTVIIEENPFFKLRQIASNGNCHELSGLRDKLKAQFERPPSHLTVIQSQDQFSLLQTTDERLRYLRCQNIEKRSADYSNLPATGNHNYITATPPVNTNHIYFSTSKYTMACVASMGDGWCDDECNNKNFGYDGGDCCPETCLDNAIIKDLKYPCGSGGYECLAPDQKEKIPVWFKRQTKFCFRWAPMSSPPRCRASSQELCAKVNDMTDGYMDNSDYQGGCSMAWKIETMNNNIPRWFNKVKICFRYYAEGDGSQCIGSEKSENCAYINQYTDLYYDYTDRRQGGCGMSWSLVAPKDVDRWFINVALCFQWNGEHCNGGLLDKKVCAFINHWTPYYLDNTGNCYHGCQMQWGLQLL